MERIYASVGAYGLDDAVYAHERRVIARLTLLDIMRARYRSSAPNFHFCTRDRRDMCKCRGEEGDAGKKREEGEGSFAGVGLRRRERQREKKIDR